MEKPERRKEISEFARKLSELAALAPDGYAKRDLHRTLHFIRQRYKVSPDAKKVLILEKIASGAVKFSELLGETGFSRYQLERGLKELQAEGKIRFERFNVFTRPGRPTGRYILI